MKVISEYSHNGGKSYVESNFPGELKQVYAVIDRIDLLQSLTKTSKEKTMMDKQLYSPKQLNVQFKSEFGKLNWKPVKIPTETSVTPIGSEPFVHKGFREMDFVKNRLGVEVQFGKYAFMVYNVSAKMTIFHKNDNIDAGIEVVGMRSMTKHMSTGVSYFEQVKTDLEMRGISDIDIPVVIMGIDG